MILSSRNLEHWFRTDNLHLLVLAISNAALAACDGISGEVELIEKATPVDARIGALIKAVIAERLADFPRGGIYLGSVEHDLAAALVEGCAVRQPSRSDRLGVGCPPRRLRRVVELVHARIEHDLTPEELAESARLSGAHFSEMFRKSTGESPHQFVLRLRVERAKHMLRIAEMRVMDVAVACGFKTQQRFARVVRQL
jgi:AraC family transcriptional regulator